MKNQDPIDHSSPHPVEQTTDTDGVPKFGRLLIALLIAVMLIVAVTFASEAFYS